jgi:hypothetical protein
VYIPQLSVVNTTSNAEEEQEWRQRDMELVELLLEPIRRFFSVPPPSTPLATNSNDRSDQLAAAPSTVPVSPVQQLPSPASVTPAMAHSSAVPVPMELDEQKQRSFAVPPAAFAAPPAGATKLSAPPLPLMRQPQEDAPVRRLAAHKDKGKMPPSSAPSSSPMAAPLSHPVLPPASRDQQRSAAQFKDGRALSSQQRPFMTSGAVTAPHMSSLSTLQPPQKPDWAMAAQRPSTPSAERVVAAMSPNSAPSTPARRRVPAVPDFNGVSPVSSPVVPRRVSSALSSRAAGQSTNRMQQLPALPHLHGIPLPPIERLLNAPPQLPLSSPASNGNHRGAPASGKLQSDKQPASAGNGAGFSGSEEQADEKNEEIDESEEDGMMTEAEAAPTTRQTTRRLRVTTTAAPLRSNAGDGSAASGAGRQKQGQRKYLPCRCTWPVANGELCNRFFDQHTSFLKHVGKTHAPGRSDDAPFVDAISPLKPDMFRCLYPTNDASAVCGHMAESAVNLCVHLRIEHRVAKGQRGEYTAAVPWFEVKKQSKGAVAAVSAPASSSAQVSGQRHSTHRSATVAAASANIDNGGDGGEEDIGGAGTDEREASATEEEAAEGNAPDATDGSDSGLPAAASRTPKYWRCMFAAAGVGHRCRRGFDSMRQLRMHLRDRHGRAKAELNTGGALDFVATEPPSVPDRYACTL